VGHPDTGMVGKITMRRTSGFTLMELLIVIAIIAILVAVAVVSYSSVQKKSRDSRRASDMKAVQNAFEQYYADHNSSYPSSADDLIASSAYLPVGYPTDPKNSGTYVYPSPTTSATGYCYCALLESGSGNSTDATCTLGTGTYYCVNNLQ